MDDYRSVVGRDASASQCCRLLESVSQGLELAASLPLPPLSAAAAAAGFPPPPERERGLREREPNTALWPPTKASATRRHARDVIANVAISSPGCSGVLECGDFG